MLPNNNFSDFFFKMIFSDDFVPDLLLKRYLITVLGCELLLNTRLTMILVQNHY
jgi:hypothetical protein